MSDKKAVVWPPPECAALQADYRECFSKLPFSWGDTPAKERCTAIFDDLTECIQAHMKKSRGAKE